MLYDVFEGKSFHYVVSSRLNRSGPIEGEPKGRRQRRYLISGSVVTEDMSFSFDSSIGPPTLVLFLLILFVFFVCVCVFSSTFFVEKGPSSLSGKQNCSKVDQDLLQCGNSSPLLLQD